MTPHDQGIAAEQYVPSPSQRVRDQVARYEATDGREGGTLEGRPDVRLQDGSQVHRLRAREVFGDEKAQAWKLADSRWPHFRNTAPKPDARSRSCSSSLLPPPSGPPSSST
jgi:hypothetical protein